MNRVAYPRMTSMQQWERAVEQLQEYWHPAPHRQQLRLLHRSALLLTAVAVGWMVWHSMSLLLFAAAMLAWGGRIWLGGRCHEDTRIRVIFVYAPGARSLFAAGRFVHVRHLPAWIQANIPSEQQQQWVEQHLAAVERRNPGFIHLLEHTLTQWCCDNAPTRAPNPHDTSGHPSAV